ncbi:MAG: O-antigen ligase family protein [Planctomycetaceae bacterium]|nr:O-antigen ligase family protein [Planctomycetaceae bacterium]
MNTLQFIDDLSFLDYRKNKMCIAICLFFIFVSALVYFFTGMPKVSMVIAGVPIIILSFFHTQFAFMVLYFFMIFSNLFRFSDDFSISKMIGIVIFFSFLITRLRYKLSLTKPSKFLLVIFAYTILSVLWSVSPIWTCIGIVTITLHIILLLILFNTIRDEINFKFIIWSLVLGALVVSIIIVLGLVDINTSGAGAELERAKLSEGTNSNDLGAAIVICLMGSIYLFLRGNKKEKIILLAIFPVLLIALLKTQARAALGTAFVAPLISFLITGKGRQKFVYIILAILISMSAFGVFKIAMNSNLLSEKSKDRMRATKYNVEESGRLAIWKRGVQFISQKPVFGSGLKTFHVLVGYEKQISSAHNNIISFTTELGIIGLCLVLGFYFLLFVSILKIPLSSLRWFAISMLMSNICLGITATSYFQKDFWYSIGFIILALRISECSQFQMPFDYMYDDYLEETETSGYML